MIEGWTNWLINWLTDWWTDWLIDGLTDWLRDGLTNWWTGWLNDWLIDWLTDGRRDWLTDWQLTECLADWVSSWVIDRPMDWLIVRLIDRLTHWLTNWPTDCLTDYWSKWLVDCLINRLRLTETRKTRRDRRIKFETHPSAALKDISRFQSTQMFYFTLECGTLCYNGNSFSWPTVSFFLTEGWFSNGCRKSFAQKNSEAACTRNGSRSTKPVWRVHRLLVQPPHLCKGSPRSVEAEQGKCKLIHLQQERIKLKYLILLVILVIISIIFVVLPFIFGRSPYGSRNNWSCPVGHNFASTEEFESHSRFMWYDSGVKIPWV